MELNYQNISFGTSSKSDQSEICILCSYIEYCNTTMEALKRGQIGTPHFVLCREDIPFMKFIRLQELHSAAGWGEYYKAWLVYWLNENCGSFVVCRCAISDNIASTCFV